MIYLVTEGEYSDYGIVHVFSDEDVATKHVEQWNALHTHASSSDTRRVEEHEIETVPPELAVLHHAEWWSHEDVNNGDGYVAGVVAEMSGNTDQLDRLDARHFDDGTARFKCSSFDPERAMKVVSDARAKHLAQVAGL